MWGACEVSICVWWVERSEQDRAELVKQTDGNVNTAISCPGASPHSRRSVGDRIPESPVVTVQQGRQKPMEQNHVLGSAILSLCSAAHQSPPPPPPPEGRNGAWLSSHRGVSS